MEGHVVEGCYSEDNAGVACMMNLKLVVDTVYKKIIEWTSLEKGRVLS